MCPPLPATTTDVYHVDMIVSAHFLEIYNGQNAWIVYNNPGVIELCTEGQHTYHNECCISWC